MNWLIVGQGAMGLLWYHHLSQEHVKKNTRLSKVSLLASTRQDLSQNHYQCTALNGQQNVGVLSYATNEDLQSADVIFLCVKSYQISQSIQQLAPHLGAHCHIILAHNGMGTLNDLSNTFISQHSFYALLTTHGCLRTAPLNIIHTGQGESNIGLISGVVDTTAQHSLTASLNIALPRVTFAANIADKQWLKLAINCVINPITALNNMPNGQVNAEQFAGQSQQLLSEIISVAKTQGVILTLDNLQQRVSQVAQATAKNSSSMRCDIQEKRPTEVDYINGYIHRLGQQHALATPENTKIWQAVKKLEANY